AAHPARSGYKNHDASRARLDRTRIGRKLKMNKKLKKVKVRAPGPLSRLRRKKRDDDPVEKAVVPYITNESLAEHREEVLKGARKHILPLQHSRRRIVILSVVIFVTTVVAFLVYSVLG